jgi:hypothetical protein
VAVKEPPKRTRGAYASGRAYIADSEGNHPLGTSRREVFYDDKLFSFILLSLTSNYLKSV